MTDIGDMWFDFALLGVKQCKKNEIQKYKEIATYLMSIADKEQQLWQQLRNL